MTAMKEAGTRTTLPVKQRVSCSYVYGIVGYERTLLNVHLLQRAVLGPLGTRSTCAKAEEAGAKCTRAQLTQAEN